MKNTVKFMSLTVLAVLLNACGNDKKSDTKANEDEQVVEQPMEMNEQQQGKEPHSAPEKSKTEPSELNIDDAPLSFNDDTAAAVWDAYTRVKNALVASDSEIAKQEAANLAMIFSEDTAKLKAMAEGIATAEDLEAQRKAFSKFSNAITNYFKGSLSTGTLYKQHCPMAFDGKGADWFSNESTIKNPYFGDKMLNCGLVTATITN
ncbi:DUF3347 domain-containing protein [Leeuwenhoekiella polynyae]|uniref:DUF3347 domain-containing protein n=1 Tax=Leeuwenhoekiella polynyae TaxID=1550906 RepID=A0A4Q0NX21_9FLAO|nr:DUF3347 domain-containing protein [Leeuwenhoekiella polynyae]RXG15799.1 putative protein DUF3347 [Leeuwenhoekiella polynyae]